MPYTLWSRGRLLGETDLGFARVYANHRVGWFHPSPQGEALMSVLTGTGPALKAVARLMRNPLRSSNRSRHGGSIGEWPSDIRTTTEYADLVSSVDELESMDLQLRDPDGRIMTVEHVGIDDMQFKSRRLPKRQRKLPAARTDAEPWSDVATVRRYQIQVYFPGSGDAAGEAPEV